MLRAVSVSTAGSSKTVSEYVELSFQDRHRRRLRMHSSAGRDFLLDFPEAIALRDGDILTLDDDSYIRVSALPEDVLDITAADANALTRIAWHLGNRHLPTAISAGQLRIAYDHVIEAMIVGLGGKTARLHAPFQPEAGAYDAEHHHA
ncbi:MAG: urease accessory protein UreE [Woeseiaceae bacterium]